MKNSFRINNDRSLKQILSDENFQHSDFYINFISPWNNAEKNSQQIDLLDCNPSSDHTQYLPFNPIKQKVNLTKSKYDRAKTEESRYFTTSTQFRKYSNKIDQKFSNLFDTDYFTKRNLTTPLKIKRNKQLQSRQKFKTPVININEFSFTKDIKFHMKTLVPKLDEKFDPNLTISKSYLFPKDNSNTFLRKGKKKQLEKTQTSKTVLMKRMSDIQRSKKLKNQFINLFDGHGVLVENLKRISEQQRKKGSRELKCRSVNKFNRTIF